jgi:hypothetical protein
LAQTDRALTGTEVAGYAARQRDTDTADPLAALAIHLENSVSSSGGGFHWNGKRFRVGVRRETGFAFTTKFFQTSRELSSDSLERSLTALPPWSLIQTPHRDACRIIRTLAFQIATRLPDCRKLLLTLPILTELDR